MADAFTRLIRTGLPGGFKSQRFDGQGEVTWAFNASSEESLDHKTVEALWKNQPHLRTVVNFLARNIAQLGLHTFKSDGESNERQRGDYVSRLLAKPNASMTRYDLVFALVADLALYDKAYLLVRDDDERSDLAQSINVIPAGWVTPKAETFFSPATYDISIPGEQGMQTFGPDQIVAFEGWTPGDPVNATSPVETLRLTLEEQHHARVHRKQLWKRNGRVGSFITRPKDAPKWDGGGRKRFYEMLDAFTGDRGNRAGGMPLLEDGMDMKRVGFSSADEQWAESQKLSLATVAQVYHVNPTMIGLLDNANYANVREFRRGLYGDTLGPIISMIEARLNAFLLPMVGAESGIFVEFNVEAKLRGSFEEQAAVVSASVGAPWMTRNEARRLQNLPKVEGGDELITPLNVLEGGQASPRDGGEPVLEPKAINEVWRKCLLRQQAAVPGKGWDEARWDRELTADLAAIGTPDPSGTAHFLNSKTKKAIDAHPEDWGVAFNLLLSEVA